MSSPMSHRRNVTRPAEEWTCSLTWENGDGEPMDFEMPYGATWAEAVKEAERLAALDYLPNATVRNVRRTSLR